MPITLPPPLDSYDKENEAQTRRIIEQSVLTVGGVDLSGVDTSIEDLEGRVTALEAAPTPGVWVELHDETLASAQAEFDIAVGPYGEYEVHIIAVKPATGFTRLQVNGASTGYNGGVIRTAATTLTGNGWGTSALLDSQTNTTTVRAVVNLRVGPHGRVAITGTGVLGSDNTGMVYAGDVEQASVTSVQVDNGALDLSTGSRITIYGRYPV